MASAVRELVGAGLCVALVACVSEPGSRTPIDSTKSVTPSSPTAQSALSCGDGSAEVPSDYTIYFDAVALPSSDHKDEALQTIRQERDGSSMLFAKAGFIYRPNSDFEVTIPKSLSGNSSSRGTRSQGFR